MEVAFKNGVEICATGELHNALVEFVGGSKPLGIPGTHLAKHAAAVGFAKDLDHQFEMPAKHPHALLKRRFGQKLASLEIMARLAKNPRIIERAAADADAGAACFLDHMGGSFAGDH